MSGERKRKILIDWGTTNVRAFLVDSGGNVLARKESDRGIKFVEKDRFPEVFQNLVGDWGGVACTLMAGMVGSANGWEEAAYIPTPASIEDMRKGIHSLSCLEKVYIVPGVSCRSSDGIYDVIRGEEVQVLGLQERRRNSWTDDREKHLICLPGTHSKWLETSRETLLSFTTVMSGDFFAAVCSKTIMSLMLKSEQQFSDEAFLHGVSLSSLAGGVMSRMFKVRSSYLFGQVKPEHMESMISGVIIGSEIDEMRRLYTPVSTVQVIGSNVLIRRYRMALEQFGMRCELHPGDELSLAGMIRLAENL